MEAVEAVENVRPEEKEAAEDASELEKDDSEDLKAVEMKSGSDEAQSDESAGEQEPDRETAFGENDAENTEPEGAHSLDEILAEDFDVDEGSRENLEAEVTSQEEPVPEKKVYFWKRWRRSRY